MELEVIVLSEISQAQKDNYSMFSLYMESMTWEGRREEREEGWERRAGRGGYNGEGYQEGIYQAALIVCSGDP